MRSMTKSQSMVPAVAVSTPNLPAFDDLADSRPPFGRKICVDVAALGWAAIVESLQVESFLLHAVHQLRPYPPSLLTWRG